MRKEVLTYVKSTSYDILLNKMYPDGEAVLRPAEEIERLIKQGHIVEWRESNKSMELTIDSFNTILLPLITVKEEITTIIEGEPEIIVETILPETPTIIQEATPEGLFVSEENTTTEVEEVVVEPITEDVVVEEVIEPTEEVVEEVITEEVITEEAQEENEEFVEEAPTDEEEIKEVTPAPTKKKKKVGQLYGFK